MSGFRAFWTRGRIIIASIIVLVVFLGIGGMIWWVMSHPARVAPDTDAGTKAAQESKARAEAYAKKADASDKLKAEAAEAIKAHKPEAAQKTYQAAIDNEPSIEEKTQLYIDLSETYYLQDDYNKAFEVAKTAEALNPDKYLAADWLARLYQDRKDYVNAAKYYRIAGDWATSEQNKTAKTKANYEKEAQKMDALAAGSAK